MRHLKTFVASSAELLEERKEVLYTLDELNKTHRHLLLERFGWETDVESGFLGQRIQQRINQIVIESDIVIGIIYDKVGEFTLDEIDLSINNNKKLFIYFKTGFAPYDKASHQLYGEVLELKEKITDKNNIIYREYKSLDGFKDMLYRDLNLYLNNNFSSRIKIKSNRGNHTSPDTTPSVQIQDPFVELKHKIQQTFTRKVLMISAASLIAILIIWDILAFRGNYKDMVRVPKGEYTIGLQSKTPLLSALIEGANDLSKYPDILYCPPENYSLPQGFHISKYEVTNREYNAFLDSLASDGIDITPYKPLLLRLEDLVDTDLSIPAQYRETVKSSISKYLNEDQPVIGITYHSAMAYAKWKGMTLPTPRQWEIAARMSQQDKRTLYPWGDTFSEGVVNTWEAGGLVLLNAREPNTGIIQGVFGMIGNAEEWVLSEQASLGEIRGGHFDSKGGLVGMPHVKRMIAKDVDDISSSKVYDHFYAGIRCVIPESQAYNKTLSDMVFIPQGKYLLGYDIQSPFLNMVIDNNVDVRLLANALKNVSDRTIRLDKSFYIDKYEVSFKEYEKFLTDVNSGDYRPLNEVKGIPAKFTDEKGIYRPDHPAVGITWDEAMEYARWMGKSLPSEEQMAIAMSGPDQHLFPWGDEWMKACCNYVESKFNTYTIPVDTILMSDDFSPCQSWCGAHHLAGNVDEWLLDTKDGDKAYVLGGNYKTGILSTLPFNADPVSMESRFFEVGFRCISDPPKRLTWKIYQVLF